MTTTVVIDRILSTQAERVWAAIEAIGGLDRWFPIIDVCRVEGEGEGAGRVMTLAGGAGEMRDRIVEIARVNRRLRYQRTHHPFPFSDYFGTVEIFEVGPHASRLVWTVRFEAAPESEAAMRDLVHNAISDGVEGLEREMVAGAA
ncbi:MAG TPA: SRPBCC family protein [Methylocystis sp.]|nr:SRPBCC family protein [Methylocystis sp.]